MTKRSLENPFFRRRDEADGNSGFSALLFEHIPLPASALPSQIHRYPYFFSAEKQRETCPHQRIFPHASAKETEKAAIFFKNLAKFSAHFLYPQRHTPLCDSIFFTVLPRIGAFSSLLRPFQDTSRPPVFPFRGKVPVSQKPRFTDKKKAIRQKQKKSPHPKRMKGPLYSIIKIR